MNARPGTAVVLGSTQVGAGDTEAKRMVSWKTEHSHEVPAALWKSECRVLYPMEEWKQM